MIKNFTISFDNEHPLEFKKLNVKKQNQIIYILMNLFLLC